MSQMFYIFCHFIKSSIILIGSSQRLCYDTEIAYNNWKKSEFEIFNIFVNFTVYPAAHVKILRNKLILESHVILYVF